MTRLLVTGATGFLGKWTLRHWRKAHPDTEIWATSDQPMCAEGLAGTFRCLDLRDGQVVHDFIRACNPNHVIHLAGLVGDASLAEHLAVNVLGTHNLYNALYELDHYTTIRVVQAGTAAIYGQVVSEELPIRENNALRPLTPYGISKMMQDYLAEMHWRTKGLQIMRARIFNLLGPGQSEELVPATFIRQLKAMCDGESLYLGNSSARRDFVDVRDVVQAFDRLLTDGQSGEAYNIASGESVSIQDILKELLFISNLQDVTMNEEQVRIRKYDVPDVFADITRISKAVGWWPQISLRESLEAMWAKD